MQAVLSINVLKFIVYGSSSKFQVKYRGAIEDRRVVNVVPVLKQLFLDFVCVCVCVYSIVHSGAFRKGTTLDSEL